MAVIAKTLLVNIAFLHCCRSVAGCNQQNCPSNNLEGLGLVQRRALEVGPVERANEEEVPVAELPSVDSSQGVGALGEHIEAFGQQIAKMKTDASTRLAKLKAKYSHALKSLILGNKHLELDNQKISAEIDALERFSSSLRQKATSITAENKALQKELRDMQSNISIAAEYASLALNSSELLSRGEDLQVLEDLARSEKSEKEAEEREQLLKQIDTSKELSMLSLGGAPLNATSDMLRILAADVDALEKQENQTEARITARYEAKANLLKEKHEDLMAAQQHLVEQRESAKVTNDKLKMAVQHLTNFHNDILQHMHSLRSFAAKIGGTAVAAEDGTNVEARPAAPHSLLQEGNAKKDAAEDALEPLPALTSLDAANKYEVVQSSIAALKDRFNAISQRHVDEITAARAGFEKQLGLDQQKVIVLKKDSAHVAKKIEATRRDIAELRESAEHIGQENKQLMGELQGVGKNLSAAEEWLQLGLDKSKASLVDSPDLRVLSELEWQDQKSKEQRDHDERLHAVGRMNMLQKDAFTSEPDNGAEHDGARLAFQHLDQAFKEMSQEQAANKQRLETAFNEEHARFVAKADKLMAELSQLKATLASERQVKGRVQEAVNHLTDVNSKLHKQLKAVRDFSKSLGEMREAGMAAHA